MLESLCAARYCAAQSIGHCCPFNNLAVLLLNIQQSKLLALFRASAEACCLHRDAISRTAPDDVQRLFVFASEG